MTPAQKLFESKKAVESQNWLPSEFPLWIIFLLMIGFAGIFFVIAITDTMAKSSIIRGGLESYLLIERIVKSPNCLAAYDESLQTTNSYEVDFSEFSNERLDFCMGTLSQDDYAFRVVLSMPEAKILGPKKIATSNWNENRPVEYTAKIQGIVIRHENKLYNGEMTVDMQNYKE